jgi:hypothetical protein
MEITVDELIQSTEVAETVRVGASQFEVFRSY